MRIGFLGLGRMGLPMVRRLSAAGFEVAGYDVLPTARRRARAAGVDVVEEMADLAGVDVVMSSLPDTPEVSAAYTGPGGVFDLVAPGTVCVDLSTCSVAGSRTIAATAAERGMTFLDAPVSGTSIHVEAGTAVIMVGGDGDALALVSPPLEAFAAAVHHVGGNGAGLALKLITNRLLTTHLGAIAEAVLDMEAMGLDVGQGIAILRQGAVPKLLDYKAKPLADRDFTPLFTVNLMRKDLRLAAEVLPERLLGTLGHDLLDRTAAEGRGDQDIAALISVLEEPGDGTSPR